MIILLIISSWFSLVHSQSRIANDIFEMHGGEKFGLLLQEIMAKTLEPAKCIVIFSDDVHSDIFEANWFKRFKSAISFILIHIEESDDLYAPDEDIQESLLLAKGKGCQMYIVLITNGLQTARLLKFGDRYRTLDTLSKFILLYDHRLFEKKLFYLWKKIINVIFIRKYASARSIGNHKNDLSWFEISTVPFPVPITNTMIPRRLDIWTRSKFRKNVEIFRDKTSDLQNQTLRVALFAHTPGITKTNNTFDTARAILSKNSDNRTKFIGIETEILQSVAKAMNFRYEIYEAENADTEMWGRRSVGGLYTGLIGEVVSTRADIALGDLYYTSFILDVMDLSVPYDTECLTFITPESLNDNSWKTLILPFSPLLWIMVLVSLSLCIISFHFLARFHIEITKMKNRSVELESQHPTKIPNKKKVLTLSLYPKVEKLGPNIKYTIMKEKYQTIRKEGDPVGLYQFSEAVNSALYTYSMILLVSLPKLPTGWSLRILTGWYWIYCLLVVTSYRASMTAILARPAPKVKIDTLEELVKSSLTLSGWGEINNEFFKSSSDSTMQRIAEHFVLVNDSEIAVNNVAEAAYAFVTSLTVH